LLFFSPITAAKNLFAFVDKYRPETKAEKADRLKKRAAEIAALKKGEQPPAVPTPYFVKYGLNHVTSLVESKKAKLVVIAHDVDPIEVFSPLCALPLLSRHRIYANATIFPTVQLVVWLPSLCKKVGVPYCIVKSKSRLGQVVHKKTSAVLAITNVRKEDQPALATLSKAIQENYNDKYDDVRKKWGGLQLGRKSVHKMKAKAKAAAANQ
jgi:large subunit ribosomal protein L7Ae